MTDIGDEYFLDDDDDVTTTPANFGEVHELLKKLKEKTDGQSENLSVMEPEFRKPKLKLNNPANDGQKSDCFKTHGFAEAKRLQQKQNDSTGKRPK